MAFTETFGGTTIYPSDVSYRAISLSANQALSWPLEVATSGNVVAQIMDVTPSAGGFTITMPPANEASPGETALFFNAGSHNFTVADNAGNTIVTITPGLAYQVYLRTNTTVAGQWRSTQFGAGTSSATAGSLVGAGIKAINTTLNQSMTVSSLAVDYTAGSADRSSAFLWTGGAGTVTLPASSTVGNDWFFHIRNGGSGSVSLATTGGELINGTAAVDFNPGDSAIIVCDGAGYFTIGFGQAPEFLFDYVSIDLTSQSSPYTLAGSNLNRIAYQFSGTLTANMQIIVPATIQQYWVGNFTTGGSYTVTIKTSGGTGVIVPRDARSILYCNGTDVVTADTGGISIPILVSQGGTGATNASQARTNLGATSIGNAVFTAVDEATARNAILAAKSGANSDITSLTGLTTPLSVPQGGTGVATLTANGVVLGNGASALTATAVGTTGQVLVGNTGGAPSFATLSGIGVTSFSAGTTGLTPSTATTGVVTLAGTLGVANGGTGTATTFTAGSVVFTGASGVYSQDNANLFWDDTNDRLGIGTSSPGAKLHIDDQNNAGFRFNEYNDADGVILRLAAARGTIASPTALTTGSTIFGVRGFGYSSAGTFGAAVASINARAAENFTATAQGSYLEFITTATGTTTALERMRIDASGNVGIGTSSPVTKLNVFNAGSGLGNIVAATLSTIDGSAGSQALKIGAYQSGGTVSSGAQVRGIYNYGGNAGTALALDYSTVGGTITEAMRIDAIGNVGIGTALPAGSAKLDVIGNIRMPSGNFLYWAGGSELIEAVENNRMTFFVASNERMRIDSAGNVGIGTSAPSAPLTVKSRSADNISYRVLASASGTGTIQFTDDPVTTGWASIAATSSALNIVGGTGFVTIVTAATERMRIDTSGNVGIGTSSPVYKLDVNGDANFGSSITTGSGVSTGDVRLELGANRSASGASYIDLHALAGQDYTSRIVRYGGANAPLEIINAGTGSMVLATNNAARMSILGTGDVGIGTLSPTGKLHVVTGTNDSLLFRGPISYATGGTIYAVNEANSAVQPMELAASSFMFNSGNVGIGVASAPYQLQVRGTGQDTAALTDAGAKGGSLYLQATANTSGSGGALLLGTTFGNGTPFAAIKALVADGGVNTRGDLAFSTRTNTSDTALTERMRLDSAGNFGIGTSAPQNKLDIVGNMLSREDNAGGANPVLLRNSNAGNNTTKSSSALFQGVDTVGTVKNIGSIGFFPDDANYIGSNLRFFVRTGDTTPIERMRIDSSGQVGIGCIPGYRLDVAAGDTTAGFGYAMRLRSNATAAAASMQFTDSAVSVQNGLITCTDAGVVTVQGDGVSSGIRFRTYGAEKARIDSSGNFGVGTTDPGSSTLAQGAGITGNSATAMFIGHANGTASGATYIGFVYNATPIGSITQDGTTAVLYNTTSDVRLKDNITDADDAASLIDAIQVRKFDWKADGSHQRYGFVAQELVTVAPEAVSQPADPDAMMGVDYSKLVPMLVKEIQSLRARVAQLEGN